MASVGEELGRKDESDRRGAYPMRMERASHLSSMLSGAPHTRPAFAQGFVCCEVFTDPTVDFKCSHSKKRLTEIREPSLSLQVMLGHQDGPQG